MKRDQGDDAAPNKRQKVGEDQAAAGPSTSAQQTAQGGDVANKNSTAPAATEPPAGTQQQNLQPILFPEGAPPDAARAAEGGAGAGPSQATAQAPRIVGPYTQREMWLQQQEEKGELKFIYFYNDGSRESNRWLIDLKNIYAKQLPNMPKEYIVRLVMDRRHRSVAIAKKSGQLMGGITYRPFYPQCFAEIAFCAITATEQVKGFGTRLMNYTKEYARTKDRILYFLTYADNNAVGYFSKQGFTKECTLAKEAWYGYIKDYEGGTLMECRIHPSVNYSDLPGLITRQREALEAIISERSTSYRVFPGLTNFKEVKASGQYLRLDPTKIPGVVESGWKPDPPEQAGYRFVGIEDNKLGIPTPGALKLFIQEAINYISLQPDSWPFLAPVDGTLVPDYYDVIKDPIDLGTMQKRLDSGVYYSHLEMFNADMRRMFSNCRIYNAKETMYYKMAQKLEVVYDSWLRSRCVVIE